MKAQQAAGDCMDRVRGADAPSRYSEIYVVRIYASGNLQLRRALAKAPWISVGGRRRCWRHSPKYYTYTKIL